jgi:hypothetical protein
MWLTRWKETNSLQDNERRGRPRCTTDDIDQEIGLLSDQKPAYTPKDIRRELQLQVSPHTMSRRLDEIGLFGRVQEEEYDYSEFDLQRRLAFANEYIKYDEDWWSTVFFSDETPFYLGHYGRVYVRRPVGASHDPKYMHAAHQPSGKVSLWGCISAEGLGHAGTLQWFT